MGGVDIVQLWEDDAYTSAELSGRIRVAPEGCERRHWYTSGVDGRLSGQTEAWFFWNMNREPLYFSNIPKQTGLHTVRALEISGTDRTS